MQLRAEERKIFGKKLKLSRKEGKLPAILYGAKAGNRPLFVNLKDFTKTWKEVGESTIVDLKEGEKKFNVLIHEVEIDPIKNEPIHVDFLAVRMDELISAPTPLVFEGEAPAVKSLGGVLVKVMHEVEVEALPADLPHELKVDISKLGTFEDRITLGDVILPKGVSIAAGHDEVIALVEPPREEEGEGEAVSTIEDIEVEKKGKQPDEEAAEGGTKE